MAIYLCPAKPKQNARMSERLYALNIALLALHTAQVMSASGKQFKQFKLKNTENIRAVTELKKKKETYQERKNNCKQNDTGNEKSWCKL